MLCGDDMKHVCFDMTCLDVFRIVSIICILLTSVSMFLKHLICNKAT